VEFTKSQIVASVPGFFFCMWYASKKHWLANNVLGIAFCIQVCLYDLILICNTLDYGLKPS
jgi:hypothetical protein